MVGSLLVQPSGRDTDSYFCAGAVNNVTCTYVQAPGDQFQSMVGEELTQMLQFFDEFGCKPVLLLSTTPDRQEVDCLCRIDYGGKDIGPSQKVLPKTAKVQTWEDFVKASDWSKVLSG